MQEGRTSCPPCLINLILPLRDPTTVTRLCTNQSALDRTHLNGAISKGLEGLGTARETMEWSS